MTLSYKLSCSEAGSDPQVFEGTSFCHCVEQVFAAIKTEKGWDEDPLSTLECLQQIASDANFDECPDEGESITIKASTTTGSFEKIEIEYTISCS